MKYEEDEIRFIVDDVITSGRTIKDLINVLKQQNATPLAVVVLIIAGFTYYISVAKGEKFKPRFLEMTLISMGVAVLSFVVGIFAKKFLGVDIG